MRFWYATRLCIIWTHGPDRSVIGLAFPCHLQEHGDAMGHSPVGIALPDVARIHRFVV